MEEEAVSGFLQLREPEQAGAGLDGIFFSSWTITFGNFKKFPSACHVWN